MGTSITQNVIVYGFGKQGSLLLLNQPVNNVVIDAIDSYENVRCCLNMDPYAIAVVYYPDTESETSRTELEALTNEFPGRVALITDTPSRAIPNAEAFIYIRKPLAHIGLEKHITEACNKQKNAVLYLRNDIPKKRPKILLIDIPSLIETKIYAEFGSYFSLTRASPDLATDTRILTQDYDLAIIWQDDPALLASEDPTQRSRSEARKACLETLVDHPNAPPLCALSLYPAAENNRIKKSSSKLVYTSMKTKEERAQEQPSQEAIMKGADYSAPSPEYNISHATLKKVILSAFSEINKGSTKHLYTISSLAERS